VCRTVQPSVLLNFLFKLAGSPSGITKGKNGTRGPVSTRDRLEDVERRCQADALVDRQGGVLDKEIGRMQNKTTAGFERANLEHPDVAGTSGQLDPLGRRYDLELH